MKDCCEGEPCFGDPRGLHSLDCPVYNAWVDRWEESNRHRWQGPVRALPDPIVVAYAAGYRARQKDARHGR